MSSNTALKWVERGGWLAAGLLMSAGVSAATGRADTVYRKLEVLAEVLGHIENHYVDSISARSVVYGAVRGAVSSLDAHSTFFTPDEYRELVDTTEGEYAGVGVEVEFRGGIPEVIAVLDDSPAARAGLLAGDLLLAVDGQPTEGSSFDDVFRKLRGPPGTKVVLTIGRANNPAPWSFTLVRNWIRVAPIHHQRIHDGVLYVNIKTFARRVAADLETLLRNEPAPNGLILDLRDNPGGLFDEAIAVCDLFISDGPIVTAIGRGGRLLEQRTAHERPTLPDSRMAVLIDQTSASAAEIVAGALKDRGRARVFGTRSYGKGSVQSILDLSDGSGLKLTIARYVTPSGNPIDGFGVEPDEPIEDPDLNDDRDPALAAAMTWLGKPAP